MEVAAQHRRNGRSDSPDGPGPDRDVLRNGECQPRPCAPGGHRQHDRGLQGRRRADRLDRPHQQQDSGQHPQQPMRRRSSSRAGSRTFHANLERRWRHAAGFPVAERPWGFTGPARSPQYATSDPRATGKTGAANPVLLNGPALQWCPAQAERAAPPMTIQAMSSSRAIRWLRDRESDLAKSSRSGVGRACPLCTFDQTSTDWRR